MDIVTGAHMAKNMDKNKENNPKYILKNTPNYVCIVGLTYKTSRLRKYNFCGIFVYNLIHPKRNVVSDKN